MNLTQILFWVLSVITLGSALMVITSKNVIHSILFLIITFFCISGHYVLLNAQFLAIVNVIVYAGAIMVLFLFVVMLMNLNSDSEPQRNKYLLYGGTIAGASLLLVLVAALKTSNDMVQLKTGDVGLIKNLGKALFTNYVFPFEISSVLFLSAMIGAVIISKREH
jgi:NADH-quinone oxidoreductase subunit J